MCILTADGVVGGFVRDMGNRGNREGKGCWGLVCEVVYLR